MNCICKNWGIMDEKVEKTLVLQRFSLAVFA